MHLVTFTTTSGTVSQRSGLTPGQRRILSALDLAEPSLLRLHPDARARQRGLNPDRPRSNTRSRSFTLSAQLRGLFAGLRTCYLRKPTDWQQSSCLLCNLHDLWTARVVRSS